MGEPFVTGGDLTARARIRNAALDLYAASGEDKVSMRAVAAEAGVAVGLVQHHFKTKEGCARRLTSSSLTTTRWRSLMLPPTVDRLHRSLPPVISPSAGCCSHIHLWSTTCGAYYSIRRHHRMGC